MCRTVIILIFCLCSSIIWAQSQVPEKPRILISTDIGGTDPDDNQSMIHLLMYSNLFDIEGLVSSPSFGEGNTDQIFRAIDLYKKDLPKLITHCNGLLSPSYLKSVTKQGRHGGAPFKGYTKASEGSDWIVKCAKKKSNRPLWVLVWGGLDDLAQALHDAPEIQNKIKVYWIGGPNKKWCANSYAYIAENFPNLWFIEAMASYRGFFSNTGMPDSLRTENYYNRYIRGAGYMGKDFINYYKGNVKMGDTPSLLYMMDGDPNNPLKESWGGSFEKINHSARIIFEHVASIADTVPVYSIIEFRIKGPKINVPADSACITLTVANQKWDGYHLGNGEYIVRYVPKQAENLTYTITSDIQDFPQQSGAFVVDNLWPGKLRSTDYKLGSNWYTDKSDTELYDGKWQGAITVHKWHIDVLQDWAKRWSWLRD